jgi:hypothetical protein
VLTTAARLLVGANLLLATNALRRPLVKMDRPRADSFQYPLSAKLPHACLRRFEHQQLGLSLQNKQQRGLDLLPESPYFLLRQQTETL